MLYRGCVYIKEALLNSAQLVNDDIRAYALQLNKVPITLVLCKTDKMRVNCECLV